jgi:alanine-synthesizing transaminase
MLSRRIPDDQSPNPLARLLEAKRRAGRAVLDLTGTNPTAAGLGAYAGTALQALARTDASRYDPAPNGDPRAREVIAAYYASRGVSIAPDRIVLTASTSEAYAHLFRLLAGPGECVAAPRPSYPLFEPLARIEGIGLRQYRLAYGGRWSLDVDSLEGAAREGTRAVIVVQPNNPTGSCATESEIQSIERICEERGAALLSDEVFSDFPWSPRETPLPTVLGRRRALTFALGGISKLCGLPQLKLGWIAVDGPDPAVSKALQGLEWIADLFLSVGSPVQAALPEILAARGEFASRARARIESNLASLRGMAPSVEALRGDGGWSAVLRLRGATAGAGRDVAEWALDVHDVHVHPGHFYDLPGDEVVVSLLTDPEILSRGLGRLREG